MCLLSDVRLSPKPPNPPKARSWVNILPTILRACLVKLDLIDCSPPGSSVHGISQAKILQ